MPEWLKMQSSGVLTIHEFVLQFKLILPRSRRDL